MTVLPDAGSIADARSVRQEVPSPKKCEGWFFRDLRENVLSCGVRSGNEPENDGQAAPGN